MKVAISASGVLILALATPVASADPIPMMDDNADFALKATFQNLGSGSYRLDWNGVEGTAYFPQWSTDLNGFFYLPEIDVGAVHDPIDLTPLDGMGNPQPRVFVRLVTYKPSGLDPKNEDFDGDGLSNWEELAIHGTDPLKAHTAGAWLMDGQTDLDGDQMPDQYEQMILDHIGDPSLTIWDIDPYDDFDGDGLSNLVEFLNGLNPCLKDSDGDGYGDRLSVDRELHLKLDESTGTMAADAGGKGRNGTLVATVGWAPFAGIAQGALALNGGSDAVELPAATLNGATDLTISLWFKTSAVSAGQTLLSGAGAAQADELAIGIENGTTVRFHTGGGNSVAWDAGRNLADGLWHHLILVRDQIAGTASLTLDGAPFGSPQAVTPGALAVDSFVLGQRHQTVSSYDPAQAFIGSLDEIRIWSAVIGGPNLTELFQPNDLDRDGLPDDHEISLFGNLATLASGADDLDGDGLTNRQEFEGGTDPNDYYNGNTPVITLLSGSGQTIHNGQRTDDPLVFLVTDGTGPLANAPVELSHLELIGGLETTDGNTLATTLTLRTDSEGKVAVHFKAD